MRLMIMTTALTFISGLALAGDTSGSTVGVQIGAVNPTFGSGTSAGSARYGVRGAFDIVMGRLELGPDSGPESGPESGVSAEFGRSDLRPGRGGVATDGAGQLKFQTGHGFGRQFDSERVYETVGGADGIPGKTRETGVTFGLGLSTAIGDHLRLGGRALHVVFDDIVGRGTELERDSFSVRVSFRF